MGAPCGVMATSMLQGAADLLVTIRNGSKRGALNSLNPDKGEGTGEREGGGQIKKEKKIKEEREEIRQTWSLLLSVTPERWLSVS